MRRDSALAAESSCAAPCRREDRHACQCGQALVRRLRVSLPTQDRAIHHSRHKPCCEGTAHSVHDKPRLTLAMNLSATWSCVHPARAQYLARCRRAERAEREAQRHIVVSHKRSPRRWRRQRPGRSVHREVSQCGEAATARRGPRGGTAAAAGRQVLDMRAAIPKTACKRRLRLSGHCRR